MATFIDCPGGGQIQVPGGRIPPDWLQLCAKRGNKPNSAAAGRMFGQGQGVGGFSIAPGVPGGSGPLPGDPLPGSNPIPGLPEIGGRIGGGIGGDLGRDIGRFTGDLVRRFLGGNGGGGQNLQGKGCPPGFEKKNGQCVETGVGGFVRRTLPGGASGVAWEPVMGRYGVGAEPVERTTSVLDCPPGMKLGKDNVCYEHLRKSERKWPPGRKPLLTGGEMNAITTAARAAKKLNRTKKKLRKVKNAIKKVT